MVKVEEGWQDVAREFAGATDFEVKIERAMDIMATFRPLPEAREWLVRYLQNPQPLDLKHPCLFFLLTVFIEYPNRAELDLATHYWSADYPELIEATSPIILRAAHLLDETEKRSYAQRAGEIFLPTQEHNSGADLIEVASEFDLEGQGGWIVESLERNTLAPIASAAYRYGIKYSPRGVAQALLKNLDSTSPPRWESRGWLTAQLLPLVTDLDQGEMVKLADAMVEISRLPKGPYPFSFAHRLLNGAESGALREINYLLERLPEDHPFRGIYNEVPEELIS